MGGVHPADCVVPALLAAQTVWVAAVVLRGALARHVDA